MSLPSNYARKVSFPLPADARASSISQTVPRPSRTAIGQQSSLTQKDELQNIVLRAEKRKMASKLQKLPERGSLAAVRNVMETIPGSREHSSTPSTLSTELAERESLLECPTTGQSPHIKYDLHTSGSFDTPLATAGLPLEGHVDTFSMDSRSSWAAPIAVNSTTSTRPSSTRFEEEREMNNKVPREIDALQIELENAFFTVEAGSTISHAIAMYYQGCGAEVIKQLTIVALCAEKRQNIEISVRAQIWKAIILHDIGDTEHMPRVLADILLSLLHAGYSDDADVYQFKKLWSQYYDEVIKHMTDEHVGYLDHDMTELERIARKSEYRQIITKMTAFLDDKFDHSEWPDPETAMKASHLVYDPRTIGTSLGLMAEIRRLNEANESLQRANNSLRVDNIRYTAERKAIPHLSTAHSKDDLFPHLDLPRSSQQLPNNIAEYVVTPGPITALMKQLGQEPCRQLPASFITTLPNPTEQWLAQRHVERSFLSPFEQSPGRLPWCSPGTTRTECNRKNSRASLGGNFSGSNKRAHRKFNRTSSWGSRYIPFRSSQVRNLNAPISSSPFDEPSIPFVQVFSSPDSVNSLSLYSSSPADHNNVKSWNKQYSASMRPLPETLSSVGSTSTIPSERYCKQSETCSSYAQIHTPQQIRSRNRSTASFDFTVDHPSARPTPLDTSARRSRKHSLPSPTNTLDPGSLPLTDTPAPTRLEAEIPLLYQHQKRRRPSVSLSPGSDTSWSSTSYEHERRSGRGGVFRPPNEAPVDCKIPTTSLPISATHTKPSINQDQIEDETDRKSSASHGARFGRSTGLKEESIAEGAMVSPSCISDRTGVARADSENGSMNEGGASSISIGSSRSMPLGLESDITAKSKRTSMRIGTGPAPLTPASKSPPSSAICIPSTFTPAGAVDASSLENHAQTKFSALASTFEPHRPVRTEPLSPQSSCEEYSPRNISSPGVKDQFSTSDALGHGNQTDNERKASSKDVRISLLLSHLETEQAATLEHARRISKPAIPSPLRRSSRASGDDDDDSDDDGENRQAKALSNRDAAVARVDGLNILSVEAQGGVSSTDLATALREDGEEQDGGILQASDGNELDSRERRRPFLKAFDAAVQARSVSKPMTTKSAASDPHNYFHGPDWRSVSEQTAQVIQEDEQGRNGARVLSLPGTSTETPNLTDWQRLVDGEDWRNRGDGFPEDVKRRQLSNVQREIADIMNRTSYDGSPRPVSKSHRRPKVSRRPGAVPAANPNIFAERQKLLPDEHYNVGARAVIVSKDSIHKKKLVRDHRLDGSDFKTRRSDLRSSTSSRKQGFKTLGNAGNASTRTSLSSLSRFHDIDSRKIRDQHRNRALQELEAGSHQAPLSTDTRIQPAIHISTAANSPWNSLCGAAAHLQETSARSFSARGDALSTESDRQDTLHLGEQRCIPGSEQITSQPSNTATDYASPALHQQPLIRDSSNISQSLNPTTRSAQFREHAWLRASGDGIEGEASGRQHEGISMQQPITTGGTSYHHTSEWTDFRDSPGTPCSDSTDTRPGQASASLPILLPLTYQIPPLHSQRQPETQQQTQTQSQAQSQESPPAQLCSS